jgi:hypothetical protein
LFWGYLTWIARQIGFSSIVQMPVPDTTVRRKISFGLLLKFALPSREQRELKAVAIRIAQKLRESPRRGTSKDFERLETSQAKSTGLVENAPGMIIQVSIV